MGVGGKEWLRDGENWVQLLMNSDISHLVLVFNSHASWVIKVNYLLWLIASLSMTAIK